ncbi:MAG TPA: class I SAM-dependent methyltransferase [Vicinamibacterales bacterium]|nr:class I SAM-dependent methyltransferase [Vicinamibacterales bacterium]
MIDLQELFGSVDIYLFDQLLRGRIRPGMRVFDAGCGDGRNLKFLMREGYDVFAVDPNPQAIANVRALATQVAPHLHEDRFRVESLEQLSFPDASADAVLSSAVLHFAKDDQQFLAMLQGSWRVLRPGGLFFCRLASTIGIEDSVQTLGGRWSALPDGSQRYLVDEAFLMELTGRLGGDLLDPLKTTVVQQQRAMTTWVMRKGTPVANTPL